MIVPGETEAAMQGCNHAEGYPGGLIETMQAGAEAAFRAPPKTNIGSKDPNALKIPARRAEYSLAESALSPFQAEPTHFHYGRCLTVLRIGPDHKGFCPGC